MSSKSDALAQEHDRCRPLTLPCRPSLIPLADLDSHIQISPEWHLFSALTLVPSGTVSPDCAHPATSKKDTHKMMSTRIV